MLFLFIFYITIEWHKQAKELQQLNLVQVGLNQQLKIALPLYSTQLVTGLSFATPNLPCH